MMSHCGCPEEVCYTRGSVSTSDGRAIGSPLDLLWALVGWAGANESLFWKVEIIANRFLHVWPDLWAATIAHLVFKAVRLPCA